MRKYLYGFLISLCVLALSACSDDDNEGVVLTEAPRIVSSLPADGAMDVRAENGVLTLEITYDQNVKIAEDNPLEKIQILRSEATVDNITSNENIVSVTVSGCEDGKNYEVYIPKGVVLAEDGTEAYAVRLSFTADVVTIVTVPDQTIAENLSNANASQEAKDLYSYLKESYRTNIISGAMALDAAVGYHSWNHEYSDWVGENTGKTPKLNGYDFGHLTSSYEGNNWIDYSNTEPVTEWSNANGIVSCMWHWNVPTVNPDEVGEKETEMWSGSEVISNWNYISIFESKGLITGAGDKIRMTISGVEAGAQIAIQSDWNGLSETINLTGGETVVDVELTEDMFSKIQSCGALTVTGSGYTITKVTVVTAGELTYGFYAPGGNNGSSETPFNATNAVTAGTWENDWIQADLEKLYNYLQLLEDANVPVIWRPLHEASGAWFWWGAQGPETYKTLWKMMYDYLVTEKGLDNLIWVWTAEADDDAWYPGDEYVDIIGRDIYDQTEPSELTAEYATLAGRFPTKMIALTECGNVANISDMWESGAKWAWFMVWYPGSSDGSNANVTWEQFATTQWWANAFGLDYVIAR